MDTARLQVVRGTLPADEFAALVVVLATRAAVAAVPVPDDAPGWGRTPDLHPGPGAWRRSARLTGIRTRAGW